MPRAFTVPANGAEIPCLGFGTWKLRGEDCEIAVAAALAAGYRHLDTAAVYDNEEAVGAGLRASGVSRDDVFVTTKVWHEHLAAGDLERSAEASLKRLGLSEVDLLLIHWPSPSRPAAETARALAEARRRGLSRHIGVSNFPETLLEEAAAAAGEPLVANQCEYHPRLDQSRLIAACRRRGMAFTSYSPLGQGGVLDAPEIAEIAEGRGKSPGQIVLRWHVQQEGVIAIPRSGNPERIRANIDIFDFELDDGEMARIHGLARPDGRRVDPSWAPDWGDAA